jgi:flagellar biosynthesis/type III secretory pathway M-ring protein FliF/YscJ
MLKYPLEIYEYVEQKYDLLPYQVDVIMGLYSRSSPRLPMSAIQVVSDVLRLLTEYEEQIEAVAGKEYIVRKYNRRIKNEYNRKKIKRRLKYNLR